MLFLRLKTEILNSIYKFTRNITFYLTGNAILSILKEKFSIFFLAKYSTFNFGEMRIIRMKCMDKMRCLHIRADCTYSYNSDLNGHITQIDVFFKNFLII